MRGGGTCLNAPVSHFRLKYYFKCASLAAYAAVVSSHPEGVNPTGSSLCIKLKAGLLRFARNDAYAFTLSEVLITLSIIGIVAALTMPNLIANHQKKVLAGQAKHAYSLLSQAYTSAVAKHDDPANWETNINVENERSIFEKYLFPELKGQASGSPIPKDKVLWQQCRDYLSSNKTSVIDMNKINSFEKYGCFALSSGELVFPDSSGRGYGDYTRQYYLTSLVVDVNGFKKPNKIGKDIFYFYTVMQPIIGGIHLCTQGGCIANFHYKGVYPAGYDGEENAYYCYRSGTGLSPDCTAKLVKDGWEFKDDYPW